MTDYNAHIKRHLGHELKVMEWAGRSTIIYCHECGVPVVDWCQGKCRDAEFLEQAIQRKFIELSGLVERVLLTKSGLTK